MAKEKFQAKQDKYTWRPHHRHQNSFLEIEKFTQKTYVKHPHTELFRVLNIVISVKRMLLKQLQRSVTFYHE
jgi:hypothetical protein